MRDFLKNRRNVISLIIVGLLILAVPVGVYLIRQQQVIKSRAAAPVVDFTGNVQTRDGVKKAIKPTVTLQFNSGFGPARP